jgi:hypothetical protein
MVKTSYGKDLIPMTMQSRRVKDASYERVSGAKAMRDKPVNKRRPVVEHAS